MKFRTDVENLFLSEMVEEDTAFIMTEDTIDDIIPENNNTSLFDDTSSKDSVDDILDDDERLKSGYTVTAEIILNNIQDATILPFEAVAQEKNGDYYIYRLENGWAYKEYIEVSFEDEKGIVVENLNRAWQICENPASFSKDCVRVKNDSND